MKTSIITFISFSLLLLVPAGNLVAQYVGAVAPTEVIKEKQSQQLTNSFFTVKCGLLMPSENSRRDPSSFTDLTDGNLSMNNGLFAEVGYGMTIGRREAGFYFYPFIVTAYMSGYSFNAAVKEDTREFTAAEIAQRYGVFYRPVKHLFIAGYYRPAAVVPAGFNAGDFTGKPSFDKGFTDRMMTHAFGLSVQYSVVAVSYEYYMGKPLMEVENNLTLETLTAGIPVRMSIIALSLSF